MSDGDALIATGSGRGAAPADRADRRSAGGHSRRAQPGQRVSGAAQPGADASGHSTGRADDALQIDMQPRDQAGREHCAMVAYASRCGHHRPRRSSGGAASLVAAFTVARNRVDVTRREADRRYVEACPHASAPCARRGQGQWALGYREPLNPNERAKRDNDGLLVRQRIIDIYSKRRLRRASIRATCAAAFAGTASTPSAGRAFRAGGPRSSSPKSSTTSTSCCGSASTAAR